MARMRAVQVTSANGPFELVERDIPEPPAHHVRVKVQACGVCHSDAITKHGLFPIQYPRVPGHEVVGIVDALGADVAPEWQVGQRVGVGWFGGSCGHCERCRRGDFITCVNGKIPGISYDGGYADYMIAPFDALAAVPEELSSEDAAPLLCAGITTFNALRNSGFKPGEVVAVLGIGGLGHLGVQYAAKSGCHTIAIARGKDKEPLARKLGAHHYIDSGTENVAAELMKFGGAKVVLATATNAKAMADTIGGLAPDGRVIVLGVAPEPIEVPSLDIVLTRRGVVGWPSGTSIDCEDTLKFSVLTDVRPMIETMPLEHAAEAYDKMMSGAARFRMVITTGH
jgi:D-arabinose 1-dehydrogenase-like Zn-dependent alcohol dehydrogenase